MLKAFSTAATGMTGQQMMVDVIANNLANINTTGFKRSQINFQDLLYVKMNQAGSEVASGIKVPTGMEVGSGVRAASTTKVFTIGELSNTGRPLDVAINGDGFLQVTMPNGDTRYTRDGALQTNLIGDWREVLQELPTRIHAWLPRLAHEGIVGADAIFACLGPALEIFSRYSRVEKASGEVMSLSTWALC